MPAILREVLKTNTFEEQRQIINTLADDFHAYSSGTGFSTFLNLVDGTSAEPALFFDSQRNLGIFKPNTNTLAISSDAIKVFDFSSLDNNSYRPFNIKSTAASAITINNSGQYYKTGSFASVPLSGGSGSGLRINVVVSPFEASITNAGSNYPAGTTSNVSISGGNGQNGTVDITAAGIIGNIQSGGSGYENFTFANVPLQNGSGTGATATLVVSGGSVTSVTITSSGSGYVNSDILTVNNADLIFNNPETGLDETSGGSGFSFIITNTPYIVTNVIPSSPWSGEGYLINDTLGVTGVSGTGLQFTLTKVGFISSAVLNSGGSGYIVSDTGSPTTEEATQDNYFGIINVVTYQVDVQSTVDGNRYFIDLNDGNGFVLHPNITFEKDTLYNFVFSDPLDFQVHPLAFSVTPDGVHNAGDEYTTNVRTLSQSSGIQILVDNNTPSTLYYYCIVHPDMAGSDGLEAQISITGNSGSNAVFTVDSITDTTTYNVNLDGNITSKSLTLSDFINIGANADITGGITVGGTLAVSSNATFSSNLTVSNLITTQNLDITSDLSVGGITELTGDLLVNTNQFYIDTTNGFISINHPDIENTPLEYSLEIYGTVYNDGDAIFAEDTESIVKIGALDSTEKLSVEGNIVSSGSLTAGDGTSANPSIKFESNDTTGFYSYEDGNNTGIGITTVSGDVINVNSGEINFYRNVDFIYTIIDETTFIGGSDYVLGQYSNIPLLGGTGNGVLADITVAFTTAITNAGSGYDIAEYTSVPLTSITSAAAGALQTFNIITSGQDYVNGTYTNVPLNGGNGLNGTANVIVSGSGVIEIFPNQVGSGYQVGDNLTIDVNDIGGSQLDTFTIDNVGSGYTDGNYLGVALISTSGSGSSGTANITVSGGAVTAAEVVNRGSGYALTDDLTVDGDAITVAEIDTISIVNAGSGYANGSYTNVPLVNSSFRSGVPGSNATANITVSGNVIISATIVDGGENYLVGDEVTVNASDVGGTGAGVIQSVTISNGGSGFSDNFYTGVSITGGSGSGATADITVTGGIVTEVTIQSGGLGYVNGETVGLNGYAGVSLSISSLASPSGLILEVASIIVGSGLILSPATLITGFGASIQVTGVASGTGGSGATANITTDVNGTVEEVIIVDGGTGYSIGDTLRVDDANMQYDDGAGGIITSATPSSQMLLTINSNGNVTVVDFVEFGEGYSVDDTLTIDNANLGSQGEGFELTVDTVSTETTVSIDEKLGKLIVKEFNTGTLTIDNSLTLSATGISKSTSGNLQLTAIDYVQVTGSSALLLPSGTTEQRPGLTAGDAGAIRYNTSESRFEGYNGSFFVSLGGVRDVDGNTYISAELNPGDDDNILRFVNDDVQSMQVEQTKITLQTIANIDKTNIDGVTEWEAGASATAPADPINDPPVLIYYEDRVYSVDTTGTFDASTPPTHTTGTVTNGDVDLTYIRSIYGSLTYTGTDLNLTLDKINLNTNGLRVSADTTTSASLITEAPEFIFGFTDTDDPLLKLSSGGALSINNGFGGTENYIQVLDYELKQFDLKDTRVFSAVGSIDTSLGNAINLIIAEYNNLTSSLPLHSGKLMIEIIDDSATPRRQYSEISFLTKSDLSDILYTENNKIYSDIELCDISVGIDGSNNITCDIVDLTGSSTTVYSIKVVSQSILV